MRARRRFWLLACATATTLVSMAVMFCRVPLGERTHWRQCYTPERYWYNVCPAAIVLALLCLFTVIILVRGRSLPRWARGVGVAGLLALTLCGYVLTATAGKFGVYELVVAFAFPSSNGSYYCEAERVGPYYSRWQMRKPGKLPIFETVRDYLDGYDEYQPEEIFPGDTMRVVTHPPGPSLLCYSVQIVLRRFPRLADRLIMGCRSVFRSSYGQRTFVLTMPHPFHEGMIVEKPSSARLFIAGTTATGLVTLVLTGLAALAVLWTAQRLRLRAWTALAFGLAALFPSLHLFSPGVDQCFPLLSVLFWTMLLIACQRGSAWVAALSGAMFFVCMGFTLAFVVALAIPIASAGIWWLSTRDKRAEALRAMRVAVPMVAGFCVVLLGVWLLTGYDTLGTWARCYRNNKQFNIDSARQYLPWLLYNPILFLLYLGGPTATLWLAGTGVAVHRTWRRRQVRGNDWLPLGVGAVIVLLWVSGINRGEVERLWMFLMPACLLAGISGLRLRLGERAVLYLLLLQTAQVAVSRVCYDAWDFARYFSKDFLSAAGYQ